MSLADAVPAPLRTAAAALTTAVAMLALAPHAGDADGALPAARKVDDAARKVDPAARSVESAARNSDPFARTFDHLLVVSVDGLRPDLLEPPHLASFPNFARLLEGAHTLDARTDPQFTITLPNHISMLTGRPVLGPYGHGWVDNDEPPGARQGGSLHVRKGAYMASMFDVAHDAGLSTSFAASKTKFWLFEQSYGWDSGARDTTGDDQGPSKIDLFLFGDRTGDIAGAMADRLRRVSGRSLNFIHFAAPDIAGHSYDWVVKPAPPTSSRSRRSTGASGPSSRRSTPTPTCADGPPSS